MAKFRGFKTLVNFNFRNSYRYTMENPAEKLPGGEIKYCTILKLTYNPITRNINVTRIKLKVTPAL